MRSLPRAWSPLRVDVRATRRLLYSSIGNSIPSATFRIPKLAPSISTEETTTVASLSSPPSTPVQPSILFQPSSSPSKGSSLSFRIPKPPPPSLVLPSTKPAPAPAFKLKLPISISHIPFVARKPTSHPPMFPRQDDPLAVGDALERVNWVAAVPGGRRGPLFRKTFKLLGADFRSGVMSRFARYLKLWVSKSTSFSSQNFFFPVF
ncbi:hypothetical protein BDY24DRAFT_287609 [Mrakia frigida]|uniref:uncharacterized protein n=1 Tax=Mrakia frigida TaxID=29902 RepID=UPI003FCC2417